MYQNNFEKTYNEMINAYLYYAKKCTINNEINKI